MPLNDWGKLKVGLLNELDVLPLGPVSVHNQSVMLPFVLEVSCG